MTGSIEGQTRLSRLHAYPAMVEDRLALELAEQHVTTGSRVLDPFCGSGRLLVAAAMHPGRFLGVDVNPLACLVAQAKTVSVDKTTMTKIVRDSRSARAGGLYQGICWRERRKVEWYSETVKRELGEIVGWINSLALGEAERTVVAVALSRAARNASFCRNGRWKLHRMSETQRAVHACSAWDVFDKSLSYFTESISMQSPLSGEIRIVCGEAEEVLAAEDKNGSVLPADLVLTSPPYGDSKSTVQYGAASSLCLDVVSQLNGLEHLYVPGAEIDAKCLGGRRAKEGDIELPCELRKYWAGSGRKHHATRVGKFLRDFQGILRSVGSTLGPRGKVVLILGRRSVGGFRVKMDIFAMDCLMEDGFVVDSDQKRKLHQKRMPKTINRYGRAADDELRRSGTTKTMDEEIILVLSRKQ